jgi:hypothetical protein
VVVCICLYLPKKKRISLRTMSPSSVRDLELSMPFDEKLFLSRWRSAIEEGGKRRSPSYPVWQGDKAYKDLERAGLLNWVQFKPDGTFKGERDWRSRKQFKRFRQAVSTYEDFASSPDESQLNLDSIIKALDPLTKDSSNPVLRREAGKFRRLLQGEMNRLREKRESLFWGDLEGLSAVGKELGNAPARKYELDARFQVKVGLLLEFQLRELKQQSPSLSLLTISRLVMLFYVANDLAEYQYSKRYLPQLRTRLTGIHLRLASIDENLRRAKLQKLASLVDIGTNANV